MKIMRKLIIIVGILVTFIPMIIALCSNSLVVLLLCCIVSSIGLGIILFNKQIADYVIHKNLLDGL
jgi:hypothetical protein